MTSMVIPSAGGRIAGLVMRKVTESVKVVAIGGTGSFYIQTLPDDPIGTHALTLNNVAAGSRVLIRDQNDTTTLSDEIATGTAGTFVTYTKTLQVYAGGSPLNNWLIKVRKASAQPYFRSYETQMTATVGASSIYVSQIPDE